MWKVMKQKSVTLKIEWKPKTLSENAEKNKLQIMSLKNKDWFQKL